jgi:hypothetical protein
VGSEMCIRDSLRTDDVKFFLLEFKKLYDLASSGGIFIFLA